MRNKFKEQLISIMKMRSFLAGLPPKKLKGIRMRRFRRDFNIVGKWLKGDKILDYGCGTGRIGFLIKRRLKKKVTLTDVINRNETPLPFWLCGRKRTPFRDGSFDTVIMMNVLHHTRDARFLIKEAARLAGRRVVIFEQHLYHKKECRGFSRKEWEALNLFEEAVMRSGDSSIFKNDFFELYYLWDYEDLIKFFGQYRLKLVSKKLIPPFFKDIFINRGRLFVLDKSK